MAHFSKNFPNVANVLAHKVVDVCSVGATRDAPFRGSALRSQRVDGRSCSPELNNDDFECSIGLLNESGPSKQASSGGIRTEQGVLSVCNFFSSFFWQVTSKNK